MRSLRLLNSKINRLPKLTTNVFNFSIKFFWCIFSIRVIILYYTKWSFEPYAGFPEGLIEFDGMHANWPSLRDLFVELVDSRGYSNLSKLLHLKRACTSPASLTLGGYDPLQDCYQSAWSALKEIYNDNYAIIWSLLDRLLDMAPAKSAEISEHASVWLTPPPVLSGN